MRLPEFEDCRDLEQLNGGDYFPQKELVCYASNHTNGIVIKNLKTNESVTVTAGGTGEGGPSFSPDGDKILFVSSKKGVGRQAFVYEIKSKSITQITHVKGAVMEPQWSPDGTKVLFSVITSGASQNASNSSDASNASNAASASSSAASATQEQFVHDDDAVATENFGYKFDGMGFIRPDTHWHLFAASADGTSETQLTDGEYDYLHAAWAPDSKKIVCVSNRFRKRQEGIGYDLLLIDVDKEPGKLRKLTEGYWLVSYPNPVRPVFTPDGKSVIAVVLNPEYADDESEMGYPEGYLYRFDVCDGKATPIFIQDDNCYQCVQFPYNAGCGRGMDKLQIDESGRYVYFVSGFKGQGNLYRLDLEGDGHAKLFWGGKQVCHGISKVRNGRIMAAAAKSTVPEFYAVLDAKTGELLDTAVQSAQKLLDEVKLSEPEDFFFSTLDGESHVHGFVMMPHDAKKDEKYPAILYIHGGPHPFYTYGLTMEFQMLAAKGFAVLYCNPRGSSGYGWTHENYQRSIDGSAYYDLLQFVDEACRRFDMIDEQRIGVTGGSYGGYMTNYMATHAKRFKAYVTQRSISNELIMYANSDMQGKSTDYKSYEDFMVAKLKESAVSYAERVDKPILILHGMDDYRTPIEGAHQFYVAIKDLHPDLPVKMVAYPHTGHEQPTDPRLLKHYYHEMILWFEKYL